MTPERSLLTAQYEKKWMGAYYFYLAVVLAKIQEVVPVLSLLRPGVLAIIILSFFLLGSKQVSYVYNYSLQIKLTIFFIILLFVLIPFADSARAAYLTAMEMLTYIPFLFSTVVLVNSKARLVQIFKAYSLILIFICCFALLNDGKGPGGSLYDENDVGLFVVSTIPLLFFVCWQKSTASIRLFWLTLTILPIMTILATRSRGALVGIIVMISIYFIFCKNKIIIALCVIFLGTGVWYYAGNDYKNKMTTITDAKEATANERLLSWQSAINMFFDKPLGVGGNNFSRLFPDYQAEGLERNMWGRVAHSLWFTLIPETGLVGIALYFSIIFHNLKDLYRIRKYKWASMDSDEQFFNAVSLSLLASLFGFFAAGSFISVLYYPIFWYLTALVVCTRNIHSSLASVM